MEIIPGSKGTDDLPDKEKIIKSLPDFVESDTESDDEDILGDVKRTSPGAGINILKKER